MSQTSPGTINPPIYLLRPGARWDDSFATWEVVEEHRPFVLPSTLGRWSNYTVIRWVQEGQIMRIRNDQRVVGTLL